MESKTLNKKVSIKPLSCLEEPDTFANFPPKPNLMFVLPEMLWLFCDSCVKQAVFALVFLSQYPEMIPWPGRGTQSPAHLPSFCSETHWTALTTSGRLIPQPGKTTLFSESSDLFVDTYKVVNTTVLLLLLWPFEGWDETTNHFLFGQTEIFSFCSLTQAACEEMNWSLSLGETMHFAVVGYATSNKTFPIK